MRCLGWYFAARACTSSEERLTRASRGSVNAVGACQDGQAIHVPSTLFHFLIIVRWLPATPARRHDPW